MVAANTSEALKEQLKDTQETVVQLQLELTTSKVNISVDLFSLLTHASLIKIPHILAYLWMLPITSKFDVRCNCQMLK